MQKKPTPKPKNLWAIVDRNGRYQFVLRDGIPELFSKRHLAVSQNVGHLNGDRVIKVTLYHPINNFKRRK